MKLYDERRTTMTKTALKRLHELHDKGRWNYEELNELDSLYKQFYVQFRGANVVSNFKGKRT